MEGLLRPNDQAIPASIPSQKTRYLLATLTRTQSVEAYNSLFRKTKKYDGHDRGLKKPLQEEVIVQHRKTVEEAMLIDERYDAILFLSRGRGIRKRDVDSRVKHPYRKHADAMDIDAITLFEEARHVNLTDAERDLLRNEDQWLECH